MDTILKLINIRRFSTNVLFNFIIYLQIYGAIKYFFLSILVALFIDMLILQI